MSQDPPVYLVGFCFCAPDDKDYYKFAYCNYSHLLAAYCLSNVRVLFVLPLPNHEDFERDNATRIVNFGDFLDYYNGVFALSPGDF